MDTDVTLDAPLILHSRNLEMCTKPVVMVDYIISSQLSIALDYQFYTDCSMHATHPCFTPLLIGTGSTEPFMSSWNDITTFNSFYGHPIFSRRWNRPFLLTRSTAFVRSTKTLNRGCFCSSCNCLRVKLMSVVGLCTLKPRCDSG